MIRIITSFIEMYIKQKFFKIVLLFSGENKVFFNISNNFIGLRIELSKISLLLLLFFGSVNVSFAQSTIDSDGDGITDINDLDDDNDGILDTAECTTPTSQIMVGWYNSSNLLPPSYITPFTSSDIMANNSTAGTGLTRTWIASAQNYQRLTAIQATTQTQAINNNEYVEYKVVVGNTPLAVTQLGYYRIPDSYDNTQYSFSAFVSTDDFSASSQVVHNAFTYAPVASPSDLNYNVINGPLYLEANKTYTFRVYFFSVGGGGAGTIGHDDFKLIGYKECDTDGDGITNRLDLDSDNDGCVDSFEGDENVKTAQLVTASGSVSVGIGSTASNLNLCANGNCVDAQGVPLIVNSGGAADVGGDQGQGIGYSQNNNINYCLDSDGDGVPDIDDLDDDNDGILDIEEDCIGYRAQNTAGTWLGGTTSTLSVTSTGFTTQTNVAGYNDGQNRFWINQNGGGQRITRTATASHSLTYFFSPGVPASEIAFFIDDVDPSIASGSSSVQYTFLVNGVTSNLFRSVSNGLSNVRMNYNGATGSINLTGTTNDQYILLKGSGSTLVTSITLTSTGTGSGDAIAYSLFGYTECDTDSDGITNDLDLDSDNDGCVDALEGAGSFTAPQLTTASGTISSQTPNQNFGTTVDANGVPTVVGASGQAVGQSQDNTKNDCIDSDGDGYPNWVDLDDDNDGILDTDECAAVNTVINGNFPVNLNGWTAGPGWYRTSSNRARNDNDGVVNSNLSQTITNLDRLTSGFLTLSLELGAGDLNNASGQTATLDIMVGGVVYATITNGTARNTSNITATLAPGVTSDFSTFGTSGVTGLTFRNVTFNIPYAGSSSTELAFRMNGGGDDWAVGNIVASVCSDLDGDGIPNYLDLDSDGDDCYDAIEGGENVTQAHLNTQGRIKTNALGVANGNNIANVDANGVPLLVNSGGAADIGSATQGTVGQPLGSSQDASVAPCCTNPPNTNPATDFTKTGISTLVGFAGGTTGWPQNVPNGFVAIESKNSGFVITRVKTVNDIPTAQRVEGMLVYDIQDACVKLYNGAYWKCLEKDCGIPTN